MPTLRSQFGVAVVNGVVYVFGGGYEAEAKLDNVTMGFPLSINVTEAYDPATDTWTTKAPMPNPRADFATAVFENKVYTFGGMIYEENATTGATNSKIANVTEVYDPTTNSWSERSPLPTTQGDLGLGLPTSGLSAFGVNGKIYVISDELALDKAHPASWNMRKVFAYDPIADSWKVVAPMPVAVSNYASAVLNGKIFVISGVNGTTNQVNLTQIYDTNTNTWSTGSPILYPIEYAAAGATTGTFAPEAIYVFGGNNVRSEGNSYWMQPLNLTQVYFPQNNSWGMAKPMPTAQSLLQVANVNDTLYVIGGVANWFMHTPSTNDEYIPFSFASIQPPPIWATSLIYPIIGVPAAAALATFVFWLLRRKTVRDFWARKPLSIKRSVLEVLEWSSVCIVSFFAVLLVSNFLSTASLQWEIKITSNLSVDLYGALIPAAFACFSLVLCLSLLKLPAKKYLFFLLFSIVLSMSVTQVVRDGIASTSVSIPVFLICAVDSLAVCLVVFGDYLPPKRSFQASAHDIHFRLRQFLSALLAASSCAALSAIFADYLIGRYVSIYTNGNVSGVYIGGAGLADGIMQLLIVAPLATLVLTAGIFAVVAAISAAKAQKRLTLSF